MIDAEQSAARASWLRLLQLLFGIACAWRFCRRWMLHAFIGWPLLAGIVASSEATSKYADVYDVAIKSPSFWREGTITRPDLRGRRLQLTEADGETHEIRCFMDRLSGSSCLFGSKFPIKARVELFLYKNTWMIFSVIELSSEKTLLDKSAQIKNIKSSSDFDAKNTQNKSFYDGIALGIITIPLAVVLEFLFRWKERVEAQRRMNRVK